ncbi:sarcosine oxidase subunit delta [Vineibacter terrae]|uniref:sarcosine oxidase subunit delta n=1 Tax=Vineibacter terrae TaxID=2586908 RepID=UPI002E363E68|nr:sarcosine oxidase subunit delta [Vineibacter terrae]HEX2889839.1 sarcosine oxidase subunit delta [Vineibacter terrae]
MLSIRCPVCGPRDEDEFVFGGDASAVRPADPMSCDDQAWTGFLYRRDNPAGPHDELWFHRFGCRRWLRLRRDTRSHAIVAPPLLAEDAGTP